MYFHFPSIDPIHLALARNDNQRLEENFRVLQKVSEDQGRTILKIRGEMEDMRNCNFRLESQVRDHESTEAHLIRKLEQCEKDCDSKVKHIHELEERISDFTEEMRSHCCDDFADSKYKSRLREVEEAFQRKNREWQDSINKIEKERDDAAALSRLK